MPLTTKVELMESTRIIFFITLEFLMSLCTMSWRLLILWIICQIISGELANIILYVDSQWNVTATYSCVCISQKSVRSQQLVPYFKSHASGLARFCMGDDQLAGLCMVSAWCFWSCMVLLHVVVGGAYNIAPP